MNLSTVCTCTVLAAASVLAVSGSSAADVLFDFESPAEIKAAPKLNRSTYRFGITNMCASSGKNSFWLSAENFEGLKKTSFSSNISFISKSFPIFQRRKPSVDACKDNRQMDQRTAYSLNRINKIYRIEG